MAEDQTETRLTIRSGRRACNAVRRPVYDAANRSLSDTSVPSKDFRPSSVVPTNTVHGPVQRTGYDSVYPDSTDSWQ